MFFVQPAPALNSGDAFVKYILSLPKAQRPKTAAYPSLDDPFSSPIADRMRSQFEKAGIKTVFKTIYPPETADLTPIVAKVVASQPDMVVGGTQSEDAYAQVKAMIQLKFNPKFLFLSNGANSPVGVPEQGRRGQRRRHLLERRLVPGLEVRREPGIRRRLPQEVRRRPPQRSTPARPRPTRSGS